jgi:hypothetical protein
MQHIGFRSATALALILPALGVAALTANAADDRKGAAPAAAPHIAAPPAPAPHISAPPAPAPHISAPPAAMPHVSAPVAMPHIAAPAPHIAPATPHIAAPSPHIAAPVHTATPHLPAPTTNVGHPNAPGANAPTTLTRQQRIEERRIEQAHGNNPPNVPNAPTNGAKTLANHPAAPNVAGPNRETRTTPNAANPNLAGLPADNRGRNTTSGLAARAQIYQPGHKPVLRNQTFASLSARDPATRALATSTFGGRFVHDRDRFEDRFDRHRFRGVVIGWVGPVFWPHAYSDFVDYTFWPYADDTFWPYAYDDVYYSMFGPYAPGLSTTYASLPATGGRVRVPPPVAGGTAQVCSSQAAGLTDWPAELIARQVQPNNAQQAALNELKDATAKAVAILQSACPTDLPSTPTGRLATMRQRIEAMLQAVQVVRPALDGFYQSLSDEQKERFNALDQASSAPARNARSTRQGPDLAQVCSADTARATALPIDRIDQLLRLSDPQRAALSELDAASKQAGQVLTSNCPQDQSLTPTGRLAAMEQRLNAMLQAVNTVQPALAKFYNSLNDEQRARFDRLPPRQA